MKTNTWGESLTIDPSILRFYPWITRCTRVVGRYETTYHADRALTEEILDGWYMYERFTEGPNGKVVDPAGNIRTKVALDRLICREVTLWTNKSSGKTRYAYSALRSLKKVIITGRCSLPDRKFGEIVGTEINVYRAELDPIMQVVL